MRTSICRSNDDSNEHTSSGSNGLSSSDRYVESTVTWLGIISTLTAARISDTRSQQPHYPTNILNSILEWYYKPKLLDESVLRACGLSAADVPLKNIARLNKKVIEKQEQARKAAPAAHHLGDNQPVLGRFRSSVQIIEPNDQQINQDLAPQTQVTSTTRHLATTDASRATEPSVGVVNALSVQHRATEDGGLIPHSRHKSFGFRAHVTLYFSWPEHCHSPCGFLQHLECRGDDGESGDTAMELYSHLLLPQDKLIIRKHTHPWLEKHAAIFLAKVATEADLGFADAYINGDFSFIDKNEGLLNLFMSNELFSLFLDETMSYSCAIFKTPDEDLKNAQLRKTRTLIEKARINKEHHVLEIGCGWGGLAFEVVKMTGCKYTGISLSEKQLQYDQIKLLLCDYRQLPNSCKYDRIIACGMIEAVGHEFMEEFFRCCESALAENGLLVLQFISMADERYDASRRSPEFIREYIFPGACVPSLSRVISAMATASRLSQIMALGFDEKFIRTWEYYFDYCAAGFKLGILGDYQIVFSRPGDVATFGEDPYNAIDSAY
ncbi:hypothetical protein BUALT_Bualt14G0059400 [Buddleja alternifolia]|uniref:Cyclopropane-fatty-acyl-phospholipid synthase n=1 Tax=Buddleja alternifolia TaxID=168488 RepID=A0AAV6WIG6_9LAMI|nr:hypothetical protein BUALT_Bualt14G0059400 [Buddleja alternifolia]